MIALAKLVNKLVNKKITALIYLNIIFCSTNLYASNSPDNKSEHTLDSNRRELVIKQLTISEDLSENSRQYLISDEKISQEDQNQKESIENNSADNPQLELNFESVTVNVNSPEQVSAASNWLEEQNHKYGSETNSSQNLFFASKSKFKKAIDSFIQRPKLYNVTFITVRVAGILGLGYSSFVFAGVNSDTALIAAGIGALLSGATQYFAKFYTKILSDPTVFSRTVKFFYKYSLKYLFRLSNEKTTSALANIDETSFIKKLNKMKAFNSFGLWTGLEIAFLAPILAFAYDYPSASMYLYTLLTGSFKATVSQGALEVSISEIKQKKIVALLDQITPGFSDTYKSLSANDQQEIVKQKLNSLDIKYSSLDEKDKSIKTKLDRIDFYSRLQLMTISLVTNSLILLTSGGDASTSNAISAGDAATGALMTAGVGFYTFTRWPEFYKAISPPIVYEKTKNKIKSGIDKCSALLRLRTN